MTVPTLSIQHLPTTRTTYQTIQNQHHMPNASVHLFSDDPRQAIDRFKELLIHQQDLTNLAFAPAIKACSKASALAPGKQIHALSIKSCLSSDVYVQTSLLTMYSTCGEIDVAMLLFEKMPERNVVSWTAMINAYLRSDQPEMALAVFREMQKARVKVDSYTIVSLVSACARLGVLNLGRWVHAYINKCRFKLTVVFIGTALVDMYCKCGSVDDALAVFNCIKKKSVQTWNAMLHGLSVHGRGADAIELFKEMEADGEVCPNEVTFVAILCGCSHSGLVQEGQFYFDVMQKKYRIKPTIKHYGCMVDLLGRSGMLGEAFKMVTEMQIVPNIVIWGALLNACRIQNNMDMAEQVIENINKIQDCPHDDTSHYVIMSNMYSQAGWNEKMAKVRMKVGKKPIGSSWIEIGCDVHEFAVGKTSHPMWSKIKEMLVEVIAKVGRKDGPDEEDLQSTHSEMVAIAFGLLTMSASTPIRITKNLRICEDCHDAMKSISEVYVREIVVRDCTRFHQFRGGCCSCKDYW